MHVRCGAGENLEIASKDYLSLMIAFATLVLLIIDHTRKKQPSSNTLAGH
ncbi:hypothetical protein HMPREF9520_00868 [Enterococcus faecalis TX1467]|nr:hypothetical protein HMPREF9520_00868 [Enterococcus faecalis TX1467]